MDKSGIGILVAFLSVVGLLVADIVFGFSKLPPQPTAYVLIVRNDNNTISMQEFSTNMRCQYALGLARGLTNSAIADCVEK